MTLKLYAHPFSSYCPEGFDRANGNGTPFEYRQLSSGDPQPIAGSPTATRFNRRQGGEITYGQDERRAWKRALICGCERHGLMRRCQCRKLL